MPSIPKAQQQALQESFLNTIGQGKNVFEPIKLDATTKAVVDIAAYFVAVAHENLNKKGTVSSGFLTDSIKPQDAIITDKSVTVNITAAKYYDYVNKGVNGAQNVKVPDSPYAFKTPYPNKKMATEILKWVRKNVNSVRNVEKAYKKQERKGLKLRKIVKKSNDLKGLAYAISAGIKKEGLKKTSFWDKANEAAEKEMKNIVGAGIKIDIVNAIKSDLV